MKSLVSFAHVMFLTCLLFSTADAQPGKGKAAPRVKKAPTAETSTPQQIAESGSYDGKIYQNDLMGFSVQIPAAWGLLGDDVNKAGLERGRKIVVEGESKIKEQALNKSVANTRVLFQAVPDQSGLVGTSGLFSVGIEKLPVGALSATWYSDQNKALLLKSFPDSKLERDTYTSKIGGLTSTNFDVSVPGGQGRVKQTYTIVKRRGVMLFFITTVYDDSYASYLAEVLETVKFDK